MKNCKIILILFFFTILSLSYPKLSFSEDNMEVGYNIQAIIPSNQVDKKASFFDLRMAPNQEQTIEFVISNTSDKVATYDIQINQAYTNRQGFIDYSNNEWNIKDAEEQFLIDKLLEYTNQVSVSANSLKKVPITIKMPSKRFDGQILAGIQVVKKDTESEKNKSIISNAYGYILGLKLTETDNEVKRRVELIDVKAASSFGKTSVVANIKNPTMDAYGHMKYDVEIRDKETNEIKRKVTYDNNMELAPLSTYGLAIDWGNKPLKSGKYVLNLIVSDAKENKWNFNKEFTITKEEADQINEVTISQTSTDGLSEWIYILIGIIILLLLTVWIFCKKRANRSAKNEL